MSAIQMAPNASGTGTLSIASPNTNSNRTITLPDATTTIVGTDATQTLSNKTISGNLNMTGGTKYQVSGVTTNALAWVNFAGATGTRNANYNVSSVTRNSTGNYIINFTNALADANYCTSIGAAQYQYNMNCVTSQSTTSVVIVTGNQFSSTTSVIDPTFVGVVIFGN